ncbi:MAG: hypothetical protein M1822_000120 [Bathelium mastoideum]|nr:MAG: hypothetical protein M1822_000120 [Bathelium mastoideum]
MEHLKKLGDEALAAGHQLAVGVVDSSLIDKDAPFSPEVPLDLKKSMPDLMDRFAFVWPGSKPKDANPEDHAVWLLDNTAFRAPEDEETRKLLNLAPDSHPTWLVEYVAAYFIRNSGRDVSKFVGFIAEKLNIDGNDEGTMSLISHRLQPFLDTVLPNHLVQIKIQKTQEQTLGASSLQGISSQILPLNIEAKPVSVTSQPFASFPVVPPTAGISNTTAFAEPEGWAIISDIDDTIKITQTPSRIGILHNTFAEPQPKAVAGMPELYAHMDKALQQPAFFYLSASPYNLYPFLKDFRNSFYPHGTILLRDASWQNLGGLISSLTQGTQAYKAARIVHIHSWLPRRKLVCLGDSTQRDPEAYGESARRFPGWIHKIFIRKVTGIAGMDEKDKNSDERFEKAFEGLPRDLWYVFENPAELGEMVDELAGNSS